jgi:hypothetical protein
MSKYWETKEYSSWKLCEDLYAITVVDGSIIKEGKILIPSEMRKFFSINEDITYYERRITISYLDGEYSFCLSTDINSGDNILGISGDFYNTLVGIWNSVVNYKTAEEIYIAFFKLGNDCYEARVGMENKNKK